MFNKVVAAVFGTSNEREIKRILPLVEQINSLEPAMKQLTDEQLRAKTEEFRQRIRERVDSIEDADEKDRGAEGRRSTRFCPRPSPSCAKAAGAC